MTPAQIRTYHAKYHEDETCIGCTACYVDGMDDECTAALALDFVKLRTELGRHFKKDQLVIQPVVHAGLRNDQELALLCRVRDTMVFLAWVEDLGLNPT